MRASNCVVMGCTHEVLKSANCNSGVDGQMRTGGEERAEEATSQQEQAEEEIQRGEGIGARPKVARPSGFNNTRRPAHAAGSCSLPSTAPGQGHGHSSLLRPLQGTQQPGIRVSKAHKGTRRQNMALSESRLGSSTTRSSDAVVQRSID